MVPVTPRGWPLWAVVAILLLLAPVAVSVEDAAAQALLPRVHPPSVAVRLEIVLDDLHLPVSVVPWDDDTDRLVVTQLMGLVVFVEEGVVRPGPFLDLLHRVAALDGEQGLFSIALEDPDRAQERGHRPHAVAAFTEVGTGDLVVAAYPMTGGAPAADASEETELLRVPMPEPFHHGGQVVFGPDGMLYVSVGDGEVANESLSAQPPSAQRLDVLRGKVLRIDPFPSVPDPAGRPYAVPADNPFVGAEVGRFGEAVRDEIWAYGFRNPWKMTFDASGELFVANVGNDRWESVYRAVPGGDHGWPAREGPECQFLPEGDALVDPACPATSYVEPVAWYAHLALDPAGGQAVTGGAFVADPEMSELAGRYVYGDYVSGRLWSWDPADGRIELLLDSDLAITSVAAGPDGAVLVLGVSGVLARLVRATP
jgi:glucose/arabinose dehydrogenase